MAESVPSKLTKIKLKGDQPFFNDWEITAVDHARERVYIYGGFRPDDKNSELPTCDFHCLDLKTMKWDNLTDCLRFRPGNFVADPFRKDGPAFELRRLPALAGAAIAITSLHHGTFLFLCGGFDGENPTSDLIAVDLDDAVWWFVEVQGHPIRPRMSAAMVAINNQLFIFGGQNDPDDDSPPIRTYSIAVYCTMYKPQTGWTWMVSDAPMPPDIPLLGSNIQAVSVYNGQKILLTQGGRVKNVATMDLSRESTVLFHTENHTFQDARATMGAFPKGFYWLQLGSLVAGAPLSAPPTPRRRGRPPKAPLAVTPVPTHDFPPSAVMFAWVLHSNKEHIVPEAWQYLLPPAERIRCLGLRESIWQLNVDLQRFVAVGNRLILLGNEDGRDVQVDKPIPRLDLAVEIFPSISCSETQNVI